MSATRLAFVTCAALLLAACAIGRPTPQPKLYVIEPPPPQDTASRRAESVRIGSVRVAAAFSGRSLIYRMDEVQMVADPYSQFIADPGSMLADQMAAWLERAGPFSNVGHPESTRPASFVLEATVTELYGDFRPGQTPAAVLAVKFVLLDQSGVRPMPVFERAIARQVELARASPDALARGYGEAFGEIMSELSTDLRGTVPAARR